VESTARGSAGILILENRKEKESIIPNK
jgi:hypothetical protein